MGRVGKKEMGYKKKMGWENGLVREKEEQLKAKMTWDEAENKSDKSGKKMERKRRKGKFFRPKLKRGKVRNQEKWQKGGAGGERIQKRVKEEGGDEEMKGD